MAESQELRPYFRCIVLDELTERQRCGDVCHGAMRRRCGNPICLSKQLEPENFVPIAVGRGPQDIGSEGRGHAAEIQDVCAGIA